MNTSLILLAVGVLAAIGAIAAIILFFVAKKFFVYEDPRIGQVEAVLPGANCGGCGYPGCKGFAEACVKAESLEGLLCPVGGNPTMQQVAAVLGKEVLESAPKVAVVRCEGSCENRPRINHYDGASSCAIEAALYAGETGCSFGCLGEGDCTRACTFGAITMDRITGLPIVNEALCTACGACVKACPKGIIELRKKGPKSRRIYVQCANKDKGAVARKSCKVACIGCSKCVKECAFEAITVKDNLAYIDDNKCRLCRKCVSVCPTSAIIELNFPPRKPEVSPTETTEVAAAENK